MNVESLDWCVTDFDSVLLFANDHELLCCVVKGEVPAGALVVAWVDSVLGDVSDEASDVVDDLGAAVYHVLAVGVEVALFEKVAVLLGVPPVDLCTEVGDNLELDLFVAH